jgi:hypothetical protein
MSASIDVTIFSVYLGGTAMKSDDPLLEESRKELVDRIKKMNELMLIVIKNHIGLEQFLGEFLEASGTKPEGLTFYEKAEASEGLNPPDVEAAIWEVVYAANELRNKIAHTFDHVKIKTKMDALRAAYLAALTPTQVEAAKMLDDGKIAAGAMELCGAYLVVATGAVRAGEKP